MDDEKAMPDKEGGSDEQSASPPTSRELEKLTEIRKSAGGVVFDTGEPPPDPFQTTMMPVVGDSPAEPASSGDSSNRDTSNGGDAGGDTASE